MVEVSITNHENPVYIANIAIIRYESGSQDQSTIRPRADRPVQDLHIVAIGRRTFCFCSHSAAALFLVIAQQPVFREAWARIPHLRMARSRWITSLESEPTPCLLLRSIVLQSSPVWSRRSARRRPSEIPTQRPYQTDSFAKAHLQKKGENEQDTNSIREMKAPKCLLKDSVNEQFPVVTQLTSERSYPAALAVAL
jgi:hypothetical protein